MIDLKIPIIIAGDVNINLLNPSNYVFVDMYIRNLFEVGMKPLVTLPTKVNLENLITRFSVIDHVWVLSGLQSDQTLIVPIDITDHLKRSKQYPRASLPVSNKAVQEIAF